MTELDRQQIVQESHYEFPYHYIPAWDGRHFSQTRNLAWGYEYLSYLHVVVDTVTRLPFESALDVGCGDGRLLFELRRRCPAKRLVGLDYSRRAIAHAKAMAPDVEWVCGDIRDPGALDGRFDVVTLVETLEHIKPLELPDFLEGVDRRVADDGTLVLTVPSRNIRVSRMHYQHFDLESLRQVLGPLFTIVDVRYLNRKDGASLRLIKALLSNRFFILNHPGLRRRIYSYYVTHLLPATEERCRRLAVVCKKRQACP
jgi:SAM-dependent methyltransferase